MGTSLYRFSDVEAKNPSKRSLQDIIGDILRKDDDACYVEMEQYLLPPGKNGRVQFDQADAVNVLLKHDRESDARLAAAMVETPAITKAVLWEELVKVLRKVGFTMSRGRLTGLLEDFSDRSDVSMEDAA